MKSSIADYRYISVLSDTTLQDVITAHQLISQDADKPNIQAELAAIRIFAAFVWGIKRWDDGLLERSRLVAANGGHSGGGVDEGHAILDRLLEGLREEDVLLSRILRECVRVGWEV